ncbi:MAG TPA: dihydrolipoamide acetyltransferase family protein [Candidatus Limnocylindria bacterium]|nr:dihydrolipoamide acetyltransferase family protein [Candidatus Limnocylindria bacterium]
MFELKMPKLGESVTEGTIGKWLKRPGEKVNKYDLLVEVQTDKVNTEIPSPVSGTLREVKVEEGQTVPIGTLLAVFDTADGEAAAASPAGSGSVSAAGGSAAEAPAASAPRQSAPAQSGVAAPAAAPRPAAAAPQAPAAPQQAPAAPPQASAARADLSDVRATPAVRKLASENGVDISEIEGTGLGGRVSKKDVEDFIAQRAATARPEPAQRPSAEQQAAAGRVIPAQPQQQPARPAPSPSLAGDTLVPLTQMRRAIANNMVQAWSAPHAHAVMPVDVTDLMKYREKVRHEFQAREGFDLSPAAFIAKAVVEGVRSVPQVNASWTDQGLLMHREINLGYAVALGEEGLIVPVIRDADGKSLAGLMRSIRDLVDRAKVRRLTLDDLTGGTFTLNNTGPLGTVVSSPIVPPGQAAILSSESIRKALTVTDDDSIAIRQMMNIVIGFDHRIIDGSTAARFLAAVRDWLQDVGPSVPVY